MHQLSVCLLVMFWKRLVVESYGDLNSVSIQIVISPYGPMDKAPAYGAGDSGFESQFGYAILFRCGADPGTGQNPCFYQ
jgi:hypothetical protein